MVVVIRMKQNMNIKNEILTPLLRPNKKYEN